MKGEKCSFPSPYFFLTSPSLSSPACPTPNFLVYLAHFSP